MATQTGTTSRRLGAGCCRVLAAAGVLVAIAACGAAPRSQQPVVVTGSVSVVTYHPDSGPDLTVQDWAVTLAPQQGVLPRSFDIALADEGQTPEDAATATVDLSSDRMARIALTRRGISCDVGPVDDPPAQPVATGGQRRLDVTSASQHVRCTADSERLGRQALTVHIARVYATSNNIAYAAHSGELLVHTAGIQDTGSPPMAQRVTVVVPGSGVPVSPPVVTATYGLVP